MYKKAGELGLPVGHMRFKGLLLHIDEIEHIVTVKAMCDTPYRVSQLAESVCASPPHSLHFPTGVSC
jgi:hypothetical protein